MPEDVLWNCEPKTKAKLEIVSTYLGAWFGILAGKGFKHVIYIDGFCGPGKYSSGEDGSPVIAARMASATAQKFPGFKATLIFIDKDEKALSHLQSLQAIANQHSNVQIEIMKGEFASKVEEIVSYLKQHAGSPTFSFIDPFGFGQSPFEKIKLLMHNEHSELFINFWCGYMNRFKEHGNEEITARIKAMVGAAELTGIIKSSDPIDAFCLAFERQLKRVGKYTLKFMMRDEKNIRDNAFFFCGRNPKGFEKIKQAMWKIDPEGGNAFSSYREAKQDSEQGNLFERAAQTTRLSSLLLEEFNGKKDVQVADIFIWVIEETDNFLPSHARKELENLLAKERISYTDPTGSNRKRRSGAWPERLLITFRE
jgi:three-Cys-motif partner protein